MQILLNKTQNHRPLLSICIPTYNRPHLLQKILGSIPKNANIQIVIINDGSSESYDHIQTSIQSFPNCVYAFKTNEGRFLAIKDALNLSLGYYSLISDDDDLFISESFTSFLNM